MATGKRYYWIKLKSSFMTSDAVDFLMSQPDGANYVVLYQMLCLKTINTGGKLERHIGEIIIPYDEAKIERDCKWFSIDTVRVALNLYKALGLIYVDNNGVLCLTGHEDLVGSETDWTEKKRRQRIAGGENVPSNVPTCVPTDVPQSVPTEIEYRDRDKSIEKEDRDRSSKTGSKSSGSKKKDTFAHDSKPYLSAVFLGKRIQMRLPTTEAPDERRLQAWADAIDKCNRLDGHPWEEIKLVLKFSQDDPFWQVNILSGEKFRKKYVELLAKMTAENDRKEGAAGGGAAKVERGTGADSKWGITGDSLG